MNIAPTDSSSEAAAFPWPLIVGLTAPVLLWPLIGLTGLRVSLGAAAVAPVVIIVTVALWIGIVGCGRVAHPIRTLTLVGLLYGVIGQLISLLMIDVSLLDTDAGGGARPLWTVLPALLMNTLWGFLAGLAAAGIQRFRGRGQR